MYMGLITASQGSRNTYFCEMEAIESCAKLRVAVLSPKRKVSKCVFDDDDGDGERSKKRER